MNLTTNNKLNRDYLGPVNTNISYHTTNIDTNQQIQIQKQHIRSQSQSKNNDSQSKYQNLHNIIQSLRYQNQSMNAMVRNKNQQIINLKGQLKNHGQLITQGNNPQNKVIREIYHMNSFRQPNGEPTSLNSVELDKATYQIRLLTKQRDDLKKYCQQLQQQKIKNPTQNILQINQSQLPNKIQNQPIQPIQPPLQSVIQQQQQIPIDSIPKQQHTKIVQQYQQHIASMASKLSTVHKLQLENNQLIQERTNILNDFQGLRTQLMNRVGYCQHLENDLRFLEQQLNKRGGIQGQIQAGQIPIQNNNNNIDIQNILNKNAQLQSQMNILKKTLSQKQDKLTEIQLRGSGYVQVTKQAFESMQKNINTLQQKVNIANEGQRKQAQKYTDIQIQLNKVNRQLAEKVRKNQKDGQQVKKLQQQKNQITSSLTKTKNQLKQMQKKYEDKQYQVQKLTAELDKSKKLSNLTQDYIMQVQIQKKRSKQSDQLVKKMLQRIGSVQQNYRKVLRQNQKARQFVQESKNKWEKYQKIIKQQNQRIFSLNQKNQKRLQELDVNIKSVLNLQQKLRELNRRNQSLTDQIQQCIKQNYYVKTQDTYL